MKMSCLLSRCGRNAVAAAWVGLLCLAACSKEGRSLVLVNVSVAPDVQSVTKVVVKARHNGQDVGAQTIDWTTATVMPFAGAVYVDSAVEGEVLVSAEGFAASDALVAKADAQAIVVAPGKVSQSPLSFVLVATISGDVDGGAGDAQSSGGVGGGTGGATGTGGVAGAGGMAGAGGVAGAGVATWTAGVNVEKDQISGSYGPALAMDKTHADSVIVWKEDVGVHALHYDGATGMFSKPVTLYAASTVVDVRVVMDDSKHALAVWTVDDASPTIGGLWESHSIDGLVWSAPTQLHFGKVVYSDPGIALAASGNGKGRVAWQESVANVTSLWSISFDNFNWSTPTKVREGSDPYERQPVMALNASGDGFLLWVQRSGGPSTDDSIWGARITGNTLGAPALMEMSDGLAQAPNVFVNKAGKGAAVWLQEGKDQREIWLSSFDGTVWKTPEKVVGAYVVSSPGLVMDEAGNMTMTWSQPLITNRMNVMASRRGVNDAAWATPVPLEEDNRSALLINEEPYPSISIDGAGKVHVAWRKKTADASPEQLVYVRDLPPGGTWTPAVKLGGTAGVQTQVPLLQTADNGVSLVVYFMGNFAMNAGGGDLFNIFAAVYR